MHITFFLTVLVALLLPTHALAGDDCPWANEVNLDVRTAMTRVQVGSRVYRVAGTISRDQFAALLTECDASPEAVYSFSQWRKMRQSTNIAIGMAVTGNWIGLASAPLVAHQAKRWRLAFQYYMNHPADETEMVSM